MRVPENSPSVRERMLEASLEYVLDHGLIGFSLRPMATEIGTSDRMLLYHFGCKDDLVTAIIARANQVVTDSVGEHPQDIGIHADVGDVTRAAWHFLTGDRGRRLSRLYIELCALSLRDPDRWAPAHRSMRQTWSELLDSALRDIRPQVRRVALQRLVICAVDGLLLDDLMTGEQIEVEAALEQFLTLIGEIS